jgi:hypothetical protein
MFVRGAHIFENFCGNLEIIVAWRVTRSKQNSCTVDTTNTQILVARVQNLVARDLCTRGI